MEEQKSIKEKKGQKSNNGYRLRHVVGGIHFRWTLKTVQSPYTLEDSNPLKAMNAVTRSADHLIGDNGGWGSDSDSNTDDSPEYYQPISAEAEVENSNSDDDGDNHQFNLHHSLPNGYASCMENGVLSLDLSDEDDIDEEDEEEKRIREESDMAIQRAFREDESRRNAPLTPENSMRVMEAMRGVSFGGLAPDWASQIPEDQWVNQLRGLRRPSPASSAVQD